jgi:hypothetical protein
LRRAQTHSAPQSILKLRIEIQELTATDTELSKISAAKSLADFVSWCRLPTLFLGVGLQKFLKEERKDLLARL